MIFCDGCDSAFHLGCHRPPLVTRPTGKWECSRCSSNLAEQAKIASPLPPVAATPPVSMKEREIENGRFLPILPPHIHPRTSMLPEDWEDYEVDPEVPDVSEWEPMQIRDFFSQKGFSDSLSSIFLEQVTLQFFFE